MSPSVAGTKLASRAMRELPDDELDRVSAGTAEPVTFTLTVTNTGVHGNETITISGARTE